MLGGFEPEVEKLTHDAAAPVRLACAEGFFSCGENRVGGELLAGLARGVEEGRELLAGEGDGIRAVG